MEPRLVKEITTDELSAWETSSLYRAFSAPTTFSPVIICNIFTSYSPVPQPSHGWLNRIIQEIDKKIVITVKKKALLHEVSLKPASKTIITVLSKIRPVTSIKK